MYNLTTKYRYFNFENIESVYYNYFSIIYRLFIFRPFFLPVISDKREIILLSNFRKSRFFDKKFCMSFSPLILRSALR